MSQAAAEAARSTAVNPGVRTQPREHALRSCAYQGTVRHHRRSPAEHAFDYRVFMLYLDLDELDTVFEGRLLWSTSRPAPARWRRRDYPGDPAQPLAEWVRRLVTERTGTRPVGPVRLLTHLRYAGRGFNPISVYYCFAADGTTLEWAVAEVTNTPWRERTHYVLDMRAKAGAPRRTAVRGRMAKGLHVSPFLPMDMEYRWALTAPGDGVAVVLDVLRGDDVVLNTSVVMRRRALSGPTMARLLATHPPMSWRVLGGIYWQALRLWRKGIPYQPHPRHGRPAADEAADGEAAA